MCSCLRSCCCLFWRSGGREEELFRDGQVSFGDGNGNGEGRKMNVPSRSSSHGFLDFSLSQSLSNVKRGKSFAD